ncbi:response regulator transcription factor [Kineosporia sp. NBRC 101731]|uniref:response regulator n=1 Tax=Kineosporia sp. NBRC 101731 TaxID=3032199 RepID=UPI0024A307FD|nr:response regulator transcription factor [Kineosporia sp. NBRC 101731]GLY29815.1 DNA-binding response regulator [Kineosporia sp. NBRC 101731]
MTRILLADDQALIRAGYRLILENSPGMDVVGEACTGVEAVDLARTTRPDIILMDLRMPEMDGLEATRTIAADPALDGVRILVLTTFENDENVVRALRAGASGFLGKNVQPVDLVQAVHTVAGGEALLSPQATRALIAEFLSIPEVEPLPDPDQDLMSRLTEREQEILVLAAHGLSNHEIARRLFLSPLTAKTHINRAMSKLGVRDRAQLVVLAYQGGIVNRGDQLS